MPIKGDWTSSTYENISHLEKTLGIGAQIADIERIRRLLGDERLIIIGHSYGAFLAALYAAEFPDHIGALVLVSPADLLTLPSPNGGVFDVIRSRLSEKDLESFDDWFDKYLDLGAVFQKKEDELLDEDLEFAQFFRIASFPAHVRFPDRKYVGTWMIRAQYFSMGRKHDYRAALEAVKAPVLVIHGANDLQQESVSKAYATAFPNAEMQTMEGAGHFPQDDKPDEFGAIVRGFLDRVER